MTPVLFALGAGVGAMARLRVNQYGWTWLSTLVVNVVGSFGLGWLLATSPSEAVVTVVGTGFFGSLTTFSMFAVEATEGAVRRRIAIIVTNLVLGLAAAIAGHAVGY